MGREVKGDSGGSGALGSVPLRLKDNLKVIDVGISVELIQKCALLGSARFLRCKVERKANKGCVLASLGNLFFNAITDDME